tara:strand:- start:1377 stop:2000 length:624 start_codon:yes stop_codon:yes gene_type:complete
MGSVHISDAAAVALPNHSHQERDVQIRSLAERFTAKEVARAFVMPTNAMRTYGELHGITFATADQRSPSDMRRCRREIAHIREETLASMLPPIQPSPGPDGIQLSPLQDLQSKKALWEGSNKFVSSLIEMSKTHTQAEALRKTHISRRQLCKLAYDHDIKFKDQIAPFDEAAANGAIIHQAAQPYSLDGLARIPLARLNLFILGKKN